MYLSNDVSLGICRIIHRAIFNMVAIEHKKTEEFPAGPPKISNFGQYPLYDANGRELKKQVANAWNIHKC